VRRDTPSYQVYKEFLTIKENEAWTEVIEKAAAYGIQPVEIANNLELQWKMKQRMRRVKKS